MFWIIKKLIIVAIIALAAYAFLAEDGVKNIMKYANMVKDYVTEVTKKDKKDNSNQSAIEKKELEEKTWSNVDKEVPKDFDSGDRPDSKLKSKIKKITNQVGGDEYGYK